MLQTTNATTLDSNTTDYGYTDNNTNHTATVTEFSHDVVLFSMYCLVNALIIISNLFLTSLILFKANLRRKLFYWRIINLCFSDLVIGLVVLPLGISYTQHHSYVWLHGLAVCRAFLILDITHFGFSALVITTICIDRLLSKRMEIRPDEQKTIKYIQIFIFVLPWIFTLFVILPTLSSSVSSLGVVFQYMCGLIFHVERVIQTVVIAFLVPNIILVFTSVTMLAMYKARRTSWYRLTEDSSNGCDVTRHLKFSTVSTVIVSCVTVSLWLPFLIHMFIMSTCTSCSIPNYATIKAVEFLSLLTSFFTPVVWLVDDDIRAAAKECVQSFRVFCEARVFGIRKSSMSQQLDENNL